jgi:hypothetical protein
LAWLLLTGPIIDYDEDFMHLMKNPFFKRSAADIANLAPRNDKDENSTT